MVAPRKVRKIVCTVVRVPAETDRLSNRVSAGRLSRPSDLLPWADPYITKLVQNLQREVRTERARAVFHSVENQSATADSTVAEMEPPSPSSDSDWTWPDEPRWTHWGDFPGSVSQ